MIKYILVSFIILYLQKIDYIQLDRNPNQLKLNGNTA